MKGKEKPWEIALGWTSVYRNPATGVYQLWYQAFGGEWKGRSLNDLLAGRYLVRIHLVKAEAFALNLETN